jgi:hypothetical protein
MLVLDDLETVLTEARAALSNKQMMKSESAQMTMRLIIRLCEALAGQPLTPHPDPTFHAEDHEERPQPSMPRRM